MSDKVVALTVTLEAAVHEDEAAAIVAAIHMIKGVASVVPAVADVTTYWAYDSARREMKRRLIALLQEERVA